MEPYYADGMDRETRRHVDRMRAGGPYYGFLLTTPSDDISAKVQEDIRRLLTRHADIHRDGCHVFFAGHFESEEIRKIRRYAENNEQVQSTKALRGPYEFFPATPDHLLERLAEYSS
jgi:hypothetical protein